MLQELIDRHEHNFTPAERSIASTLLTQFEELPFLNATEIAASLNLYPSSITRFAQKLGFKGYPDLQQAVRAHLRRVLAADHRHTPADRLTQHLDQEIVNLTALRRLPAEELSGTVGALAQAPQVWLFGDRSSAGPIHLLAHFLNFLRPDVHLLGTDIGHFPEPLLNIQRGDALVLYSLQRYSRVTTLIARECIKAGGEIILVSNGGPSPVRKMAKHRLDVQVKAVGGYLSPTTLMSLSVFLGVSCAERLGTERLQVAERLWETFALYEQDSPSPGR